MGAGVLTAGFLRAPDGAMQCEGVPLDRIAAEVGTPVFVYSSAIIRDRYARLEAALSGVQHRIHYTLKANSSRGILRLLRELGAGAEVVSGGELQRALKAGFAPGDIIFGGVGKTDDELREAIRARVMLINVESEAELRRIDELAREANVIVPVGLRINPELSLATPHEYIKTGEKGHKFGIPHDEAVAVARVALRLKNVALAGLDMHLGSQLSRVEPYHAGAQRLAALFSEFKGLGASGIRYLDIGGGLGVRYEREEPLDLAEFSDVVLPLVARTGLSLLMEPGRFLVGNAGALVATVLYRKATGGKQFIVADAGMTELLRPSHYGAYHRIERVGGGTAKTVVADVVGPVCESGDFLALDREIEDVKPGEQIMIHDVGAYGYAMASTYNGRRRPAEVLVDGDRYAVITQRETYEDLMRLDVETPNWRA
jgi:diaminopimelate decarboxylase